jgi:BirA family biotin operon repressor/biotin-[acetyl-CoA-carboxylase] ligase
MKFTIRRIEVTASTNDDAKRAAETGAPEGLVVWALTQTAGRGRQGRAWQSPEGNLYFSVLLRPPLPKRAWGNYSFVAALAISEVVRGFLPDAIVELKWPNDVLAQGKKISGILLESGGDFLIAGIGLNVQNIPENPLYPATSLAAEKSNLPPLEDVLNAILESFNVWYVRMNEKGFAPIRAAWLAEARKGNLRVRLPDKTELVGEFVDLDSEGNLHLRLQDGTERNINAGDVFF